MEKDKRPKISEPADMLTVEARLLDVVTKIKELIKDDGIKLDLLNRYIETLYDFENKFRMGTSDPDNFLSLTNIESLVMGLTKSQSSLNKELAWDKLNSIDETPLIERKKKEYLQNNVKLRIDRRLNRTIVTLFGKITYGRMALIPSTPEDEKRLLALTGKKYVFPLDEVLGINQLPFKISVSAMLEIAHWVQEIPSYQGATRSIRRNTLVDVKEDTIRAVANHIGSLVFETQKAKAEETWAILKAGKLQFPNRKLDHDLYIETDGAMIHTRLTTEEATTIAENEGENCPKSIWMENKLGMVFSSRDFIWWKDKNGETQHKIGKREYIAFIGPAEEFKKYLFDVAIRNGYGQHKNTILLSDGATWIRKMKDELFPDAQQILDLFHLCENINKFSKDVFDLDENVYKPWTKYISDLFRESKYKVALKEISQLGKKRLSKSSFNLINYINNNITNIDYATYKKNGWYVGSGAIESANKTVLQFRLKQPGMMWRQDCGQGIVSLMTKARSNLWGDVEDVVCQKYDVEGAGKEFANLIYPSPRNIQETSCLPAPRYDLPQITGNL